MLPCWPLFSYWLQYSTLTSDGRSLIFGDSMGYVTAVDLRSKKVSWQADCCEKKVQTVSLCPGAEHLLACASLDRTIRLFDLRKVRWQTFCPFKCSNLLFSSEAARRKSRALTELLLIGRCQRVHLQLKVLLRTLTPRPSSHSAPSQKATA